MDQPVTTHERRQLEPRAGLCAGCCHLRLLSNGRSVFVYCRLADSDPRFPRYPPLPVLCCDGHRPAAAERAGD